MSKAKSYDYQWFRITVREGENPPVSVINRNYPKDLLYRGIITLT